MARSTKPAEQPASSSPARIAYLTIYNLIFAGLWTSVLVRSLQHISSGNQAVFHSTESLARWIQTASLLEVRHAAIGLVKSPVGTTATQILTRVIQVWLVWFGFPGSTSESWAFTALVMAWSVADGIRYMYLTLNLHGVAPGWLVWLRYSMFYPLYPIGIGAEWWLMYLTVEPGRKSIGTWYRGLIYFLLALYFFGAFKMFTYMVKQRKKTLGARRKAA